MRTRLIVLVLLALATVPVPSARAAPTCESLERAATLAGNAGTARTESCHERIVSASYTYERWWNLTTFRATDAGLGANTIVTVSSVHEIYAPVGQRFEYWGHGYGASTVDPDNPLFTSWGAGAGNQQGRSGGQCGEQTGLSVGAYGPLGYSGVGQAVYGGSSSPYVLPCTPTDVQSALP